MYIDQKHKGITLILLLVLSLCLTSCKDTNAAPYILGEQDPYTEAFLEEFPDFSLEDLENHPKKTPLYAVKTGNLAECLDVQAHSAMEDSPSLQFHPQFLTTVVLAVDRSKTDAAIDEWSDLTHCGCNVSFPPGGILGKAALASVSYSQGGEDYTEKDGLALLETLSDQGQLKTDDPDAPVVVCFDTQAASKRSEGKNLEIIVPRDGTLSFLGGFLSKSPMPGVTDETLLSHGLRLPDGSCDPNLYPDSFQYRNAFLVSDFAQFSEVSEYVIRDVRRQAQHIRLYTSADSREHILSFIGTALFFLIWSAFALYRCYRKDLRLYIFLVTSLSIGWILVSLAKYQLYNDLLSRLCWYAYYIPLLCLPLATLYIASVIDKSAAKSRPPKWFLFFVLPCPLLIGLIFTNDFHQLVFSFNPKGNWANDYQYEAGYYLTFLYCFATFLTSFALLAVKSSRGPRRFSFLMPIFVAVFLILYNIGYVLGWRESNYTLNSCLLVLLFSESLLHTGLLPGNRGYQKLFSSAPFQMQLLDLKGNPATPFHQAQRLTRKEQAEFAENPGQVYKRDENTLLHSYPISGGCAVWLEDITVLNALKKEIADSVTKLEAANSLLQQEQTVSREKASADIKAELLTELEEDLSEKNVLLSEAVSALPEQGEVSYGALSRITILLCYIKRRSNLFFLAKEGNSISGVELTVYLDELSEFASFAQIRALVRCEDLAFLPIKKATLYYDCYFTMLWWAANESHATLIGCLNRIPEGLSFSVLSSEDTDTLAFQNSFYRMAESVGILIESKKTDDHAGIWLTDQPKGGEDHA